MKFESFYSSSKSNFYVVTAANGKRLLVECGCTWKKLLKALDYKLENVLGCCVTHSHDDHCHCIEDVLENGIDVYASEGTFKALGVEHRQAMAVRDKERFFVDNIFEIFPFDAVHDIPEPLGYKIKEISSGEEMLFATDTMLIKPNFGVEFNIVALCCNFDGDIMQAMVDSDNINEAAAKRINNNHMSVYATLDYLRRCCNLDKCTEIYLLHMSGENIDQEKIRAEIENEFYIKTIIAGRKKQR